jgi:hypothetical protein
MHKSTSFYILIALSLFVCFSNAKNNAGALYLETNAAIGNGVGIFAIGHDGLLTYSSFISTNGVGQSLFNNGTKLPSVKDTLGSQDAIAVGGGHLFVVNAGSDTISTFKINKKDPTQIRLLNVVSSRGNFPMSVAYSEQFGVACVLNGGKKNGIACFQLTKHGLEDIDGALHYFHVNLTTPPTSAPGESATFSDIAFSHDSALLYVLLKGNPSLSPPTIGWIATFRVNRKGHSISLSRPRITKPDLGAVFFSVTPFQNSYSVIYSDPKGGVNATGGYGIANYDRKGHLHSSTFYTIAGQKANCWEEYSAQTGNYYFTDPGTDLMYEVSVNSDNEGTLVNSYPTLQATDITIAQIGEESYAYLLVPGVGFQVVHLIGPGSATIIQTTDFTTTFPGLIPDSVTGATTYIKKRF